MRRAMPRPTSWKPLPSWPSSFSAGEARVTHDQNLLLPWVRATSCPRCGGRQGRPGQAQHRLLTDMIACPGGDFCALANARSLPIAAAITERYQDLDELHDLGEIDLHISGCINSCGHHHSGHIGILGVDKDGKEWYQVTLGGSDGSALSGDAVPARWSARRSAAAEVPDVIEALLDTYRQQRRKAAGAAQRNLHRHPAPRGRRAVQATAANARAWSRPPRYATEAA
jgi:sulfite reductase (NADPH) hemoprotein beta-component